jgi:solute carrier family 25 carnitine/acylcarnitine transporter 20/29
MFSRSPIKASDLKFTPDSHLITPPRLHTSPTTNQQKQPKMSADFWAGYVSGAAGIIIGNPLDIVKVNLQRGDRGPAILSPPPTTTPPLLPSASTTTTTKAATSLSTLLRGTAAPILGYGALNALMFITYNRCMVSFSEDPSSPSSLSKTFVAGALGGLATFLVSAPTELIKCRVQVSGTETSSWAVATQLWRERGVRGLYWGGGVTSLRDSVGYGF